MVSGNQIADLIKQLAANSPPPVAFALSGTSRRLLNAYWKPNIDLSPVRDNEILIDIDDLLDDDTLVAKYDFGG